MPEELCLTFSVLGNLRQSEGSWYFDAPAGSMRIPFIPAVRRQLSEVVVEPFELEGEPVEIRLMLVGRTSENTELRERGDV